MQHSRSFIICLLTISPVALPTQSLPPPMTHTSNTKLSNCQNSPAVSDFSAYNPPCTSSLRAQLKGHPYREASSSPHRSFPTTPLSWASVSITALCLSVWAAQSYHSLAMWPWTRYLTPLSLSSLFVKWCRYIVRIKWVNPCRFRTVPGTSQVLRFHYNYEFAYPSVCLFDSELLGIKDNTMSNT